MKKMLESNLGPFIHIGLPVLDIVKVKEWYRSTLGFKIIHEPSLEEDGTTIHISFLQKGGLVLELYELFENEKKDYHTRKNGFIDHLALKVNDVENATKLLIKNGAKRVVEMEGVMGDGQKSQMFMGIYGEKLLIAESKEPGIEDFDLAYIGIAYSNQNEIIIFYKQLGFELLEDPKKSSTLSLRYMNIILKFFFETKEALMLRNDGYIDHIAFDIKDIERAHQEIKASGIPVIEQEPVELPFWEKGIKYFNFRGPGGEKLEFEQRLL